MYFQDDGARKITPNFDESIDGVLAHTSRLEMALGEGLEVGADTLSIFRGMGGIALAKEIAETPDYQSWGMVGKFGLLAITDAEGQLARAGRWLKQEDEEARHEYKSYLDQITDKILVDSVMKAIAWREKQNGHHAYARAVNAAANTIIIRDVVLTGDRIVGTRQGLDTRAQSAGKSKTLRTLGTLGFALSPPANSTAGRAAAAAALLYSAKESIHSGRELHTNLQKQRIQKATLSRKLPWEAFAEQAEQTAA